MRERSRKTSWWGYFSKILYFSNAPCSFDAKYPPKIFSQFLPFGGIIRLLEILITNPKIAFMIFPVQVIFIIDDRNPRVIEVQDTYTCLCVYTKSSSYTYTWIYASIITILNAMNNNKYVMIKLRWNYGINFIHVQRIFVTW